MFTLEKQPDVPLLWEFPTADIHLQNSGMAMMMMIIMKMSYVMMVKIVMAIIATKIALHNTKPHKP